MAANHEYIIDSEEWREYQELRRREAQRRRNHRHRVDIPALLVLLLVAVACGYVLYSRYFGATPVISIAPQRPATAPAMQPAPVAPVSVPAPAVQPAPDTNNPAVSAPDDYQEHSKPSTRSAPPVAEPTARRLCGLCLPRNQPARMIESVLRQPSPPALENIKNSIGGALAEIESVLRQPSPPAALIESEPPEPAQTEHTKQNTRKAPGAK